MSEAAPETERAPDAGEPSASHDDRPVPLTLPPREAVLALAEGAPCPACGAPLAGEPPSSGLFLAGRLKCGACGLETPPVRSALGALVHGLSALVVVLVLTTAAWLVASGEAPALLRTLGVLVLLPVAYFLFLGVSSRYRPELAARAIRRARGRLKARASKHRLDGRSARLAVQNARPGTPCPACGERALEGGGTGLLVGRPALRCPRCKLELPLAPTSLGWIAAAALATALCLSGALIVLASRDALGQGTFGARAALGGALVVLGFGVGYVLQGAGDLAAAQALQERRRQVARLRGERQDAGLPPESARAWFQENLEAVVVAIILALVIRHFVMEAFVIPTGSMAPTLYGDHFWIKCDGCGYSYAVGKRETDLTTPGETKSETGTCPSCETDSPRTFTAADVEGGNKILVNKFEYRLRKPRRWEVVVFKYPDGPSRNFIKRLLGLPGEHIFVDERGDLFVDHEPRPRPKPRAIQEELWMPVYDSRHRLQDAAKEPWDEAGSPRRFSFPPGRIVAAPGAGDAWIVFNRKIEDRYGYNPGKVPQAVGDVRVRAVVTPEPGAGHVRLALAERDRVIEVTIPVADAAAGEVDVVLGKTEPDPATSASTTAVLATAKAPPLVAGRKARVAFAYVDRRVVLELDGREVVSWEDPHPFPQPSDTRDRVRLGAGKGGAAFDDVRIDRDIFYRSGWGRWDPSRNQGLDIPKGKFFCLGDNSPNSQDSREWGFVSEPHLIGRAFFVFWPPFQWKPIR